MPIGSAEVEVPVVLGSDWMAPDLLFARIATIVACIAGAALLAFVLWQLGDIWFCEMNAYASCL